jgi:HlyD family secretion protein
VAAVAGGIAMGWVWTHHRRPLSERYTIAGVRRANLNPTLSASGQVQSAKRTEIECQLENITVGVRGQRLAAGGASVLLRAVPEGTFVKRGDVLAVLDSSDYEELLRVQRITVERAKADKLQAELDCEIAKLAVREFRDGTMKETVEDFQARITLARADRERAQDRLDWSRRMKEKGYVPASTVTSDQFRLAQSALIVQQEESAFTVYQKYTAAKTIRELEGAVMGAEAILQYQQLRTQRNLDRLATLEKQVELCTIRAPHDGFVIYANDPRREVTIEEGMPVRQYQRLFFLPDLNDMEVVAMLHESIVDEIQPGMTAKVEVEGMPDQSMEGRVASVAPLASFEWRSDVRYFQGIVKLKNPPHGLRPGMTAQVEIAMPPRENVLAVPSEAVTLADGHDVCFVVGDAGVERRAVKLGEVTGEMTEVKNGLREGEQVVLNPQIDEADVIEAAVPTEVTSAPTASAPSDGLPTGAIAASH